MFWNSSDKVYGGHFAEPERETLVTVVDKKKNGIKKLKKMLLKEIEIWRLQCLNKKET